jgi:hypothetical protein
MAARKHDTAAARPADAQARGATPPRISKPGGKAARVLGALALAALPVCVQAGSVDVTLGNGPGGFDSYALDVDFDLGKLPLGLNAGYYTASVNGDTNMEQVTAGMSWEVSETARLRASLMRIDDNIFVMEGGDLGVTFKLAKLWRGKQPTDLNIAYGRMDYTPDTARNLPAALLASLPEQEHVNLGLTQGITDSVSINLGYDKYDYTKDPVQLATAIGLAFLRHGRNPPNAAYTIAAFPDHTLSAGVNWDLGNGFNLSLDHSASETVVDQRLRNTTLGIAYQGEKMTFGVNISRNESTEVRSRGGTVLYPASHGTYLEFSVGLPF